MARNTLPDPPVIAVEPPPMTPDIREKAERLNLAASNAETRVELLDILSQALIEAHKAGREEMRAECDAACGPYAHRDTGHDIRAAIRSLP